MSLTVRSPLARGDADLAAVGSVLAEGRDVLAGIGVTLPPSEVVRCCVDWSEQRHHVAGALGRSILVRLFELEWLRRAPSGRALVVTERGERGLAGLGVRMP
jgi:hypothetical protein